MQVIKGFINIHKYVSNTPGQISDVGEISTWSMTYSRDPGDYVHPDIPGYTLKTMSSVDADTLAHRIVPEPAARMILAIGQYVVQYCESQVQLDSTVLQQHLLAHYDQQAWDFKVGPSTPSGPISLPQSISFRTSTIDVQVWLSDPAFSEQYEGYEIVIVPPLAQMDDMFGFYHIASDRIRARSLPEWSDLITAAKQSHPETYLRLMSFPYLNVLDHRMTVDVTFGVIIYGAAGDQIDTIKDTIIDYILSHSSHTRAEWAALMPELFKRTEFVIVPRWDRIAVPNLTNNSALYSSIVEPLECIQFAQDHVPDYLDAWIRDHVHIVPHDYKSLMLLIIDGPDNITGKTNIRELFPDYIPISTASLDFSRMAVTTQNWLVFIEGMLIQAESATAVSSMSKQYRRVQRAGVTYISGMYQNVQYLVLAKFSLGMPA